MQLESRVAAASEAAIRQACVPPTPNIHNDPSTRYIDGESRAISDC
jgi:hypothetical protein